MKIHLISIGGSIMHNLAISLQKAGHLVTGSDDEIYNPARNRLQASGLLPRREGWYPENIHSSLDLVILGMHARENNPELQKALALKIPVVSFPEFIFQQSQHKKRVVVTGSHGKTTTTSMILHCLTYHQWDVDYLVGAQLEGFDMMVHLSDAGLMIIEGDEYLSSAIDRVPKIWHYYPQLTIITGIAWDHMNVFPTWDSYLHAFSEYLDRLPDQATVFYYEGDKHLPGLLDHYKEKLKITPYAEFSHTVKGGKTILNFSRQNIPLQIFGKHNLENLQAAYLALKELGLSDSQFIEAIRSFKGAAKRLQTLQKKNSALSFLDFAHAPSKVRATVAAVKNLYPDRRLTACLELHTYSSLNQAFLPQYAGAMDQADQAIVYYNTHTLAMKKMPALSETVIQKAFQNPALKVFTENRDLKDYLIEQSWIDHNLLLMTSGTFNGMDMDNLL